MAISQVITLLPTAPSRADPDNFATEADAFVAGMEDMPPELNTWATQANSTATSCNTNETNSASNVTYSAEWANKAEDSLVSASAGGDEVDDYSAKHFAIKSSYEVNYASEWANKAEDSLVSAAAGGDEVDDYSAKHFANKAAASALTATNAPSTNATSATSLTIATGSQSLSIQTGKAIVVGMEVIIARTSAPTNRMSGVVTSYVSGTGALDVTVNTIFGSGTYTDWTVSLSAPFDTSGSYTWTGDHTFTGHQFFNEITESQYAGLATSGTMTLDPANGTVQYVTLTGNITSVTDSLTNGQMLTLMVDDGAGYTVTGGAWLSMTWVGGNVPTLATSGYNVIELWKVNSVLYGSYVGAA